MKYSNSIKRYRIQKGLTQEELGKIVGTGQDAIARLENGTNQNPTYRTLSALSSALGVTIDEMMKKGEA